MISVTSSITCDISAFNSEMFQIELIKNATRLRNYPSPQKFRDFMEFMCRELVAGY